MRARHRISKLLLRHGLVYVPPTQLLLAQLVDYRLGRVAAREPTLEDAYVQLVAGR
jgi:hypothetical protein